MLASGERECKWEAERWASGAAGRWSAADAVGRRLPGKGTGYPAPSPQTRTSAINASGSSVATSVRQWRTTQATPRLAHNCADPGPARACCAILWSFMDMVGEPRVSPRGPSRKTLCPAVPSLQWVPWVAVPPLLRYYAPLRLPPAHLGSLRLSLASRYRTCFTAFVVSLAGSWPGRSPQVTPGPLVARSPNPGCMHGDRWFSQVPEFPLCRHAPRVG